MNALDFIRGVLVNIFVLLGFVTLYAVLRDWSERSRRVTSAWGSGLLFGVMAVATMLVPAAVAPGRIFDARAAVIGTAGLLGGPLTALASLPLPMLYRIGLGGVGMIPGLLEIVLPGLLGAACHVVFARRREELNVPRILAASALVGAGANLLIFALILACLPRNTDGMAAGSGLVMVSGTFVAMTLLSALMVLERKHARAMSMLADAERRMLHSQKMAAIGQLARRVAHNVMNTLTVVNGNAELVKRMTPEASAVQALMDRTIEVSNKTSQLAGDLLAFSHPGPVNALCLDSGRLVSGVQQMLAGVLGPDMEVVVEVAPDAGRVKVDPDRIEQALMHLAVNGAEAMSQRGRLTIRATRAELTRKERQRLEAGTPPRDRHLGDFALITVTDNGCGMPPDELPRIFEPFYSTKKDRANAGLGLSTVYNIVQLHSGYIDVKSRPGHGTTFFIYLPACGPGDR